MVSGAQIFAHMLYIILGYVKCLKDIRIIRKFRRANAKKCNVLHLWLCCRGILLRKRYPLKDLEEMEQMVACAIPLKFKVAL